MTSSLHHTLYSGSLVRPGQVLSVGVPTSLNTLFSCSSTSLPGKRGRPLLAISGGRSREGREGGEGGKGGREGGREGCRKERVKERGHSPSQEDRTSSERAPIHFCFSHMWILMV